jgi:hypothetical protein
MLYGRAVEEAWARVGSPSQVCAVESSMRTDGPDAGTRRIRIVNGDLEIELLPDRGLDLGQVRVGGVPLAWISPTGFPPATSGDVDGRGWMRAFGGGLLTTCGLLNFGPAVMDDGVQHPMHGRYSGLSAQVVRADASGPEIVVAAIVHEATLLGSRLELRRTVRTRVGTRRIRIADEVVNRGARPVAPMVLYHLNFGWPLIDEGTILTTEAVAVHPRDDDARAGIGTWAEFPAPTRRDPEQVFHHQLPETARTTVEVRSPAGLAVRIGFDPRVLPGLFQWKVPERSHYVLGVEPATAPTILGRRDARERGMLHPLEPGESLDLSLDLEIAVP